MKFNKNDYRYVDLSEVDYTEFTATELDSLIHDTIEVLKMTKRKVGKSIMNVSLASGLLAVRGGEFKSVNAFIARWKKGNTSKEERKLIKTVMRTAKWYFRLKVIMALITRRNNEFTEVAPILATRVR